MRSRFFAGAAALAVAAILASTPASAARWGGHWGGGHWGHWGGWGSGGFGLGLAAGSLLGGAFGHSSSPYYGYGYPAYGYSYYGYPNYSYGYGEPRDQAYCISHFRSYDPATETYLGYDGARHFCP
jgi:hypothetical protein